MEQPVASATAPTAAKRCVRSTQIPLLFDDFHCFFETLFTKGPFGAAKKHCISPIPLYFCNTEYFKLFHAFVTQFQSTA
jgi:hypothetical protein